jgi:hypothetical protein
VRRPGLPVYWAAPGQQIPVFQGNGDHGQTPTTLSVWPEAATIAASGGKDSMVSTAHDTRLPRIPVDPPLWTLYTP